MLPGVAPAAEYHFYHPDALGSNVVVTNGAGEVVQRVVHTPYGRMEALVNGSGQSIDPGPYDPRNLFTGQEHDPESELNYYGARYQDPAVGRFLSADPALTRAVAGGSFDRIAGDPAHFNTHAYVGNAPTVNIDPSGEVFETILDIGFFLASLYSFAADPGVDTAVDLGLDTAGLAIPFVPAGAGAVRRVGRIPMPKAPAKVVDAQGNPTKLTEGAHIEFPASEAHLLNTPTVAPSKDVRGFSTDERFVLIGPKGEVVIGEGRNRAVAAGADNATIPTDLGGAGEPGVLRYPLGFRDAFQGFVSKADPDAIVRPNIGQGGFVRYRKDPLTGAIEPVPRRKP